MYQYHCNTIDREKKHLAQHSTTLHAVNMPLQQNNNINIKNIILSRIKIFI